MGRQRRRRRCEIEDIELSREVDTGVARAVHSLRNGESLFFNADWSSCRWGVHVETAFVTLGVIDSISGPRVAQRA
jgi:hypothetical protein